MGSKTVTGPFLGSKDETTFIDYLNSTKFSQASSNCPRLANKLKTAVGDQLTYEIEQILRTIYSRFSNNSEKICALTDSLYYGAIYLIDQHNHLSGQGIGVLFLEASAKLLQARVESLDSEGERLTVLSNVQHHLDRSTRELDICRKLSLIALCLPNTELGRTKFIADALRILSPKVLSRDLLHEVLANRFYDCNEYAGARYHFLCSACVGFQAVGNLLVDLQTQLGTRSEADLFIAQFVLQYLSTQDPTDSPLNPRQSRQQRASMTAAHLAISKKPRSSIKSIVKQIFAHYTEHNEHPDLSIDDRLTNHASAVQFFKLPLLNFLQMLLSILDGEQNSEAEAFKFLIDTYEKAWSRDPNYQGYLNRIGVLYFGVADPSKQQQQQASASGAGGFFNNILISLLDATSDDEEDDMRTLASDAVSSYDELD